MLDIDQARTTEEWLERIDLKLDALISALAEDVECEGPTEDLEGEPDPVNAGGAKAIDYGTL